MSKEKDNAARLAAVAQAVQRLGVLLGAGTTPVAAWGYLEASDTIGEVATLAASGVPIPEAIVRAGAGSPGTERTLWRATAAAWAVATDAGAPLAPTLLELATGIRDLVQSERDFAVALASPVATARLVLALPVVGLVFGTLLGFNTLDTLVTTPVGWTCLVLGGGLMLVAARWNRRMVRAARPADLTPGLELDLLAIAVGGGGAIDRARASVASALATYFADADSTEGSGSDPRADAVLDLSARAGVPAASLLRSEAIEARRSARADVAEGAQALSVRLMLPLGLCVLPAFMLLSVVPLVVTVLASTAVRL